MNTIKVKRDELLAKIQENLVRHNDVVAKAVEGYQKVVTEALEAHLADVKAGKKPNLQVFSQLTPPTDMSEEYKSAIAMLEMSTDDIIELDARDFRQLVENKWSWRVSFLNQNAKYVGGSLQTALSNDSSVWNIEEAMPF